MDFKNIKGFSFGLIGLSQVDSTNSYLKREANALFSTDAFDGSSIFVATAASQSAGRGQRGAVWESADGKNLLMSILLRPGRLPVKEYYSLSVITALAMRATVQHYGADCVIKWPNDIYCCNGKLAGILLETDIESSFVSQAVIGVGLNVNQQQFPEMSRRPVSLSIACGREFDCNEVQNVFLEKFACYYVKLIAGEQEELFTLYKESLIGYREPMTYRDANGEFEAVVQDVRRDGNIVLKRSDGTLSIYAFKEVGMVIWGY